MTQAQLILQLLRSRGDKGMTGREAIFEHGITRMAAVVFDLKAEGHDIRTIDEGTLPDGRRKTARYVLVQQPGTRPGMGDAARAASPKSSGAEPDRLPFPSVVEFPCGCKRTADNLGWERRCARHEALKQRAEVPS